MSATSAMSAGETADAVARLLRLGRSLAAEFGHEHSCKWGPGSWRPDRHLLTFARRDIAGDGRIFCQQLTRELGLAPCWHDQVMALWPMASHVHLGLEAEAGRQVWKLYLESPRGWRVPGRALEPGWRNIHQAFKWPESDPQAMVVTDYDALLTRGLSVRLALVATALQAHPALQQAIARLLEQVGRTQAGADAMLLRVTDRNTDRVSVDINLYPLGWRVGDGMDWLPELAACSGTDAARVAAWAERISAQTLGHLAVGTSAKGQPFVTVYHGMHGCHGTANCY